MVGGTHTTTIPVDPTLTTQLNSVAGNYEFYRITSLKAKLYAPAVMAAGAADENVDVVLCYLPGVTAVAPTAALAAGAMWHHVANGSHCTPTTSAEANVPYCSTPQTLTLKRRDLVDETPNKWYKTQANATSESLSEIMGFLYLVCDADVSSTSDVAWSIDFYGTVELTGMIATNQNPMVDAPRVRRPAIASFPTKSDGVGLPAPRSRVAPA
jgi:hypothetical protein